MHTERVTFLATPALKATLAARAAAGGVSIGEYIRRKVEDEDDQIDAGEEAALALLVAQANGAIPKMAASLERMITALDDAHEAVDRQLREAGIRK
ncbi:hypothetical protein [uncultured Sphingomonas sp.]|uniref:hypothetical protein n=1 Tax=uncultured Sphingomonas sp. TaxID=158754 RepID=UPI0025FD55AF|nr:hypothetical protein [uncultured Sphingomonas sp.]